MNRCHAWRCNPLPQSMSFRRAASKFLLHSLRSSAAEQRSWASQMASSQGGMGPRLSTHASGRLPGVPPRGGAHQPPPRDFPRVQQRHAAPPQQLGPADGSSQGLASRGASTLSANAPYLTEKREQVSAGLLGKGAAPAGIARQRAHRSQRTQQQRVPSPLNGNAAGVNGSGLAQRLAATGATDLASRPPQASLGAAAVAEPGPAAAASSSSSSSSSSSAVVEEQARYLEPEPRVLGVAAATQEEEWEGDDGVSDEALATAYANEPPPDVCVVNTVEAARRVAARLMSGELAGRTFACDTEVADIDIKKDSPCCHGRVICFSVYCGPDVHFGPGDGPEPGQPPRSMLWVDTWLDGDGARAADAAEIAAAFAPFFASPDRGKVWHNYSFDRHVLERGGLRCAGFAGDTMHMARLWDSSRTGPRGGYSLEALSSDAALAGPPAVGQAPDSVRGKVSMKKLFGRRNIKKDGTEGKLLVLPSVEELQRSADTRWRWVNYSAYDAKSTWDLHAALERALDAMPAAPDAAVAGHYAAAGVELSSLLDVYRAFWRPFGELLTEMEAAGMAVDRPHLAAAEVQATADQETAKARFRGWATARVPDAAYMNVGSGPQVSQLLFAGVPNRVERGEKAGVPLERVFKVPNQRPPAEGDTKKPKKTMEITLHSVWGEGIRSPLVPEVYTPGGVPACSTPVLKTLAGKAGRARKALAEMEAQHDQADGLEDLREEDEEEEEEEEGGAGSGAAPWPTDDAQITASQAARQDGVRPQARAELERIAAERGYGRLFSEFNSPAEGLRACAAVDSLVDASAVDTLLSNFIVPLQSDDISKPDASGVYRVHCSLNINTETGRLSARRPNLQNQPALEKDRYRVRRAFTADVGAGHELVVADYGQLELRILAHMAGCRSMIDAFEAGGDFHSRTALGMYDHIQRAIEKGDCLLEWDGGASGEEPPPVPLLKDLYASERRRAKVLNFSIAYGKTAHGLSKDWKVSLSEAEDTVARWYSDRPEVRAWQAERHREAQERGYVSTLLGRRRNLPDARSKNKAQRAHALRAAINTPIQGSAADVATAAMVRIADDPRLAAMGWRLLLQVHDEVILEGPSESAAEAQRVVVECMRSPFAGVLRPLLVDLAVDAKHAGTWYDAK